jgi:integrase/recombinase XerD
MKSTEKLVKASVTIDKRRMKADGTYPVKVYVWDNSSKKGKFYGTRLSASERDFHSAWETIRPRKEFLDLRHELQSLEVETQKEIDRLEHFTFERFEARTRIPSGEENNVIYHLNRRGDELKKEGRISSASGYHLTAKALERYSASNRLSFAEVTPRFLQNLEDNMIQNGLSATTVGIYLRNLRAVFNSAIESMVATQEQYPFGRKKYVIPSGRNTKKALSSDQLRLLRDAPLRTDGQRWARAIFLFSYACNGMNMKDIAKLTWAQVKGDRLEFIREKTKRTKKDNRSLITVFLNDFHRDVLKWYATDHEQATYVFPILKEGMGAVEQHRAVQAFTRSVNQHLEKICAELEFPKISTYWARHSFATVAVRKGASMEFMRESLGHSDMKTTLNYFAGFADEAKRELSNSVMDF